MERAGAPRGASLWQRASAALGLSPGLRVLAICMSAEPLLPELARRGVELLACDWHHAALQRAVRSGLPASATLPWTGPDRPSLPGAPFDAALCDLAQLEGRAAFADAVRCAVAALKPGGRLLVCGGRAEGVGGAALRLGAWLGSAQVLAYGGRRRILSARRAPEAAVPPPERAAPQEVALGGVQLRLLPADAVFARGLPDAAAALLAATMAARGVAAMAVCDVGCGGGALGLCALRLGAGRCTAVDENLRALAAVRANAAHNGLAERVLAVAADAVQEVPGGPYPLVLCNPPFHAGPAEDRALGRAVVASAWAATARGGRLFVVASGFLRYEREVPALREVAAAAGFRVLCAVRP